MSRSKLLSSSLIVISMICILSFSSRAPSGRTGAPDENSCMDAPCHGLSPEYEGNITFDGFPSAVVSGQTFEVSVSLTATTGNPIRGGISVVALGKEGGDLINVGEFTEPGEDAVIDLVQANGRMYLDHAPAKFFNNSDVVTYTAKWITPNAFTTDTVTLYAAAVLANGDGRNRDDKVIFATKIMPVVIATDADGDGFNSDLDCDDTDPDVNPGATEIVNNDVDENCDGIVEIIDLDNDGFNSDEDCEDFDATINPGEREIPNNDIDENCDGIVLIIDVDEDGFNSDEDCNDNDATINPGATEIPNNDIDENCDEVIEVIDVDGDGFSSDEDCDDNDATINPDATEIPNNGIDENCDTIDGDTITTTMTMISGVIADLNNMPIGSVIVSDTTSGIALDTTDSDGSFSFLISDESIIFSFSKEGVVGDGVSSSDLVIITNHILNRVPFTNDIQVRIADVNKDEAVSATDLVLIKRIILDLPNNFSGPVWNFQPSVINVPTITSADTIRAFKIGDINGTAIRE